MNTTAEDSEKLTHSQAPWSSLVGLLEWSTEVYDSPGPREFRRKLVRAGFGRFRARLDPIMDRPRLERILQLLELAGLDETLQRTGIAEYLLGYRPGLESHIFAALEREAEFVGFPVEERPGVGPMFMEHDLWDCGQLRFLRQGQAHGATLEVHGGIRFSDDGPILRKGLGGDLILGSPFEPFTPAERMRVVWRVDRALSLIAEVPSPTRRYVPECVDLIFARKFGDGQSVHSNSRTGRIGWIFLGNPHIDACSVGKVVEMILHEGLHHDLALREYQVPFLTEDCPTADRMMPSPWTGDLVSERNLSHAILVWFGLACFFERYGNQGELAGFTDQRLSFYRAGFTKGNLARNFESPSHVHPCYLELLDRIQERALSWP